MKTEQREWRGTWVQRASCTSAGDPPSVHPPFDRTVKRDHLPYLFSAGSSGAPVALGLLIIIIIVVLVSVAFYIYKKKRSHFSSTVRYERTFNESDATAGIYAD